MNIFYLDPTPSICAEYHCDKHVVKMILESAQMLCTSHRLNGRDDSILYKVTHQNHPSSKWARESTANYLWLYDLFSNLCAEYTHRYSRTHLTESKLHSILSRPPELADAEFTEPPQCMPEQYHQEDTVEAYRQYYLAEKTSLLCWTHRDIPAWTHQRL